MRKIVCILIIVFIFKNNLFSQDCTIYHKGFFTFSDSSGTTILVDRGKKYQYELDRTKKIRTQYRIDWIDDCTYSITQTITNSRSQRKNKNKITKVTISKADGENGYYYTCSCLDDSQKKESKYMKKISKQEFYQLY